MGNRITQTIPKKRGERKSISKRLFDLVWREANPTISMVGFFVRITKNWYSGIYQHPNFIQCFCGYYTG
jgi:hypothetical protein